MKAILMLDKVIVSRCTCLEEIGNVLRLDVFPFEEGGEDVRRRQDVVIQLAQVAVVGDGGEALVVRVSIAPSTPLALEDADVGAALGRASAISFYLVYLLQSQSDCLYKPSDHSFLTKESKQNDHFRAMYHCSKPTTWRQ